MVPDRIVRCVHFVTIDGVGAYQRLIVPEIRIVCIAVETP